MSQTLTFTLGDNIHTLVRDAYWFEERKEWAMKVLGHLHGITEEQKQAIINGDAKLVPIEDGKQLQLVYEEDKDFKWKLHKHMSWRNENYFKLGEYWITKKAVMEYVNFVVKQYRLMLRNPFMFRSNPLLGLRMEDIRTGLHEMVMLEAGFTERSGGKYLDFAVALDELVSEAEKDHRKHPELEYTDVWELQEYLIEKYGEFGRKKTISKTEELLQGFVVEEEEA